MSEPYFVVSYANGRLSVPMLQSELEEHITSMNVGGKIFLCVLQEVPGLEARVTLHWPNEVKETSLPPRTEAPERSPVQPVQERASGVSGAHKGNGAGPIFPRAKRGRPKKLLAVSN